MHILKFESIPVKNVTRPSNKQKDTMQHNKFIHGIIANKELYGNQVVPVKEIACDQCDLVFKYKKNLNVHKKKKTFPRISIRF